MFKKLVITLLDYDCKNVSACAFLGDPLKDVAAFNAWDTQGGLLNIR
jgi:hypothetical protein